MTKLKKCNTCSNEIATNATYCPKCGAKNKKPIYKRWWFIAIVVFIMINVYININSEKYRESYQNQPVSLNETVESNKPVESNDKFESAYHYNNNGLELKSTDIINEDDFNYTDVITHIDDHIGENIVMNLKVYDILESSKSGLNRYVMCTETLPTRYFDIYIPDNAKNLNIGDKLITMFKITGKSIINNGSNICADIISFKLNN